MTLKEKLTKKASMFSLTRFLQKQADKKLSKLELRAERRTSKKEKNNTTKVVEHVHDENCNHDNNVEEKQ